jgi:NDP-sugar pyrophosphorylase family protein
MKAMIFAAGLGTRLKPLTQTTPKALVVLQGKPLLQWLIERLMHAGYDEFIVNVHHFSEQVKAFLAKKNNFGIRIEISDESDLLLDTGGGLKKASWFFDDGQPFLVHNVDVLTDLDLTLFRKAHIRSGALVTLAARERETSRYLLMDDDHQLCGWENQKTGERIAVFPDRGTRRMAFSGIHMIDPGLFESLTESGKYSIIPEYLRLAATQKIRIFPHPETAWLDVGKPLDLRKAEEWKDWF